MSRMSRFATAVAVSGGLSLVGMSLATGAAQADDQVVWGGNCPVGHTCGRWCPGDSTRDVNGVNWDWNVCHTYVMDWRGIVDVDNGVVVYAWPNAPAAPPTPPPPPPPPAVPFCHPPGALIPIGPVCP